jgi:hypothetical protein
MPVSYEMKVHALADKTETKLLHSVNCPEYQILSAAISQELLQQLH